MSKPTVSTATNTDSLESSSRCQSCGASCLADFHELRGVPVHSVVNIQSRAGALTFPKGDISLAFCNDCGFIGNRWFRHELLSYARGDYEATQGFSATFRSFARRQARQLVERYALYGKDVLEIGCGDGEFLQMVCGLGGNRGIGFDPAFRKENAAADGGRVTFVKDYYSERYADCHADFVLCRMTLEHINAPGRFIGMLAQALAAKPDTTVFFQIPDATRILRTCAFEDIYYEHCSYFSPGSLARLFRRHGFGILDLSTDYGAQYIMIEARLDVDDSGNAFPAEDNVAVLRGHVDDFCTRYARKMAWWKSRIEEWRASRARLVIWGAGSKGIAFLTTLGLGPETVAYGVDINSRRHGTFMAGSGQQIVGPEFLREFRPDTVVVMNAVYRDEIRGALAELGLHPALVTMEECESW